MLRCRIVVALVALLASMVHAADLAEEAKRILTAHCNACHGTASEAEGEFGYVLNVEQLKSHEKLVPKDSKNSKIIKRIVAKEMPEPNYESPSGLVIPIPPMSAGDLELLKKWIDAGAPDFNPKAEQRDFITNAAVFDAVRSDLQKRSADAQFLRYFTLTHLPVV